MSAAGTSTVRPFTRAKSSFVISARDFSVRYQSGYPASATVTGMPANASGRSTGSRRSNPATSAAADPT